jgi:hypothetical protein
VDFDLLCSSSRIEWNSNFWYGLQSASISASARSGEGSAFACFLLRLDFDSALRIKFIEQPGELADGRLIRQPFNLVAFECIGESLVVACAQVYKAPRRIVLSPPGFALARHPDIDQLDRKVAVAQMEPEIVPNANSVNQDQGETGPELLEEINDLPAGVLTAPGTHIDDPASIMRTLLSLQCRPKVHFTNAQSP